MQIITEALKMSDYAIRTFVTTRTIDRHLIDKLFEVIYTCKFNEYSIKLLQAYISQLEGDEITYNHSVKVAWVATALSHWMGLSIEDCRIAMTLGLLHDVGKIGMPSVILNKPDRLSAKEFDLIKFHPVFGSLWLRASEQISDQLVDIVSSHHEKPNGSGYPGGTTEELTLTRILSIADIYEALTGSRSYKEPLSIELSLKEMDKMSERGDIDSKVYSVFQDKIKSLLQNQFAEPSVILN